MSITFSGVPFLLDTARVTNFSDTQEKDASSAFTWKQQPIEDLVEELNRRISFDYLQDFDLPTDYPGRSLGALAYRQPIGPMPNPTVKIGDWYYPNTAMRWSVFRGLASTSQVNAMKKVVGCLSVGKLRMEAIPHGISNRGRYVIQSPMYLLPPRPLAEHGGKYDGLYLVTLVDERYFWQYSPVSLEVTYASKWENLIKQLSDALNAFILSSNISPVYGTPEPDSHLWSKMENAAVLLDAVAYNVGRVVVRQLDGIYYLLTPPESWRIAVGNRELVIEGEAGIATFEIGIERIAGGSFFENFSIRFPQDRKLTAKQEFQTTTLSANPFVENPFDEEVLRANPNVESENVLRTFNPANTSDTGARLYNNQESDSLKARLVNENDQVEEPDFKKENADTLEQSFEAQQINCFQTRSYIVPGKVTVSFPAYSKDGEVPYFINNRYSKDRPSCWFEEGYGQVYSVEVPLLSGLLLASGSYPIFERSPSSSGTFSNPFTSGIFPRNIDAEHGIKTTAKALYSGEVDVPTLAPANASGLQSMARQIATDYYNSLIIYAIDEVYPGIKALMMEGLHDVIYTYSTRKRLASTRVIRTQQWNSMVKEFQHCAPPLSGSSYGQKGVGGPSVAQSIRDSQGYTTTPTISLNQVLLSGDTRAYFNTVHYLPTQNRWRGRVTSVNTNEVILFEGTSGGIVDGSSFLVNIVKRGDNGTLQVQHPSASTINQVEPNVGYGINLITYEKGQFTYPSQMTSGGLHGLNVVPQLQTVKVLAGSGILFNSLYHYSGELKLYDPPGTDWLGKELVWVVPRTSGSITSGRLYAGQLIGYSASGKVAPVYATDEAGSATDRFLAKLTAKVHDPTGVDFIAYSWTKVTDSTTPTPVTYTEGTTTGMSGSNPAYHMDNIDLPVPNIVYLRKGVGNYYFIDERPRVEHCLKLPGGPNASGYYAGTLIRWDQSTARKIQLENVLLKDMNSPD